MPTYELEGQVAAVTGAGRGIGRAVALRLAREGAAVVVADIDESNAAKVAEEIVAQGGQAIAVKVDVSNKGAADEMVRRAVSHFGRLDILVNNAGIGVIVPLLDADEETWDRVMDVNAKGVLLCSQAAARQMIQQGHGGRIINNVSGAGKIAPGKDLPLGVYAASKHAALALTKQLGLELSSYQILVTAVCAGIVDTEMWDLIDRDSARLRGKPVGSVKEEAVDGVPLGRIQQPEDVANVVAFLASTDASYITAQSFNVCGGLLPY